MYHSILTLSIPPMSTEESAETRLCRKLGRLSHNPLSTEAGESGNAVKGASTRSSITSSAVATSHFGLNCSNSNGSLAYSVAMC
jgi:hypothetical protein